MDGIRLGLAPLAAAGIIVLLAGCGGTAGPGISAATAPGAGSSADGSAGVGAGSGSPQPTGMSPSPGGTAALGGPSASPVSVACRALAVKVDPSQMGAAAGSAYYPIDFTNKSAQACALEGFPGVSFTSLASRDGRELGSAAQHDPTFDPVAVRVAPGGHAHAWLEVSAAGNYPAAACQPTAASWLRVYPPGDKTAGFARVRLTACAAAGATQLSVMPVRAGLGSRGSTP